MSIINNGLLLASGADAAVGYQISRSIRLNSADSAYFSRTPGSAGSRTTWTWSGWVKRGKFVGDEQTLFAASTSSPNNQTVLYLSGTEKLDFRCVDGSSLTARIVTTAVYRDTGAWMHVVLAVDTTQATASNRFKLYVNGSQVTALDTATYPSQNYNTHVNNTIAHSLGLNSPFPAYPFDGYLADIYFLDGTATTPSTFAETDAITGQWVPKTPTGISYGTNGFRLTFSDNSGTTSTTLGKDAAGSNNFTPNNFSVASGSGNDSLVDSPTSYGTDTGAGGEVRGNYATLNPLQNGAGTLANGNLDMTGPASAYGTRVSTIGVSTGKWYFEATPTNGASDAVFGITPSLSPSANIGNVSDSYGASYGYLGTGSKLSNNSSSAYGASISNNDVVGVAFDADAGTLTFYKNGSSQGTAYSSIPSKTYFLGVSLYGTTGACNVNFGQRAFAYTAPSGFKALCDTNLTAPTIAKPANYFDVKLYTGNGTSQTVSGYNFGPEFVWIKVRNTTFSHQLWDAIRGTNKLLSSDSTAAEISQTGGLTAFNSDGFSVGDESPVNSTNRPFVAWAWDAAGSNSTNTSGTITSTVRANATAGFSVVSWTSDGSSSIRTMGHGLGATPSLVIIKNRDISDNWTVYHSSFSNLVRNYIFLNSTAAVATRGIDLWSTFSSTTFGLDQTFIAANGQKCIAYCFAPVAGYSAFGSYTGNGSTDGPFVFTGHRSRWLMVKRTDVSDSWYIYDTARNTYNVSNFALYAQSSLSEQTETANIFDVLSNGFKVRGAGGGSNVNGGTYIWASFAENPFQYARAR